VTEKVQLLPSKLEVISSNFSTNRKEGRKEERGKKEKKLRRK
jgi:hypothetical protein